MVKVGLCRVEIHLSEARSLKEKRMVLSRIKGRLRSRFNLGIAEVEYQDLWQRAGLALVAVGTSADTVDQILAQAADAIERDLPGEVVRVETEALT